MYIKENFPVKVLFEHVKTRTNYLASDLYKRLSVGGTCFLDWRDVQEAPFRVAQLDLHS